MSKVANAKAAQGYTTEKQNCGNCGAVEFSVEAPQWVKDRVAQGVGGYTDEDLKAYARECNFRCGLGGFAIKKTATCQHWRAKEPEASPSSRQEV